MLDDPSPSKAPILVRLVSDSAYDHLAKTIEEFRSSCKVSCLQFALVERNSWHAFDSILDLHRNTNGSGRGVGKGIDAGKEVDKCCRCDLPNQEPLPAKCTMLLLRSLHFLA